MRRILCILLLTASFQLFATNPEVDESKIKSAIKEYFSKYNSENDNKEISIDSISEIMPEKLLIADINNQYIEMLNVLQIALAVVVSSERMNVGEGSPENYNNLCDSYNSYIKAKNKIDKKMEDMLVDCMETKEYGGECFLVEYRMISPDGSQMKFTSIFNKKYEIRRNLLVGIS